MTKVVVVKANEGRSCSQQSPEMAFVATSPDMLEEFLVGLAKENENNLSQLSQHAGSFKKLKLIEFVFLLCEQLGLHQFTRYQAVEILDRFMIQYIDKLYSSTCPGSDKDTEKIDWTRMQITIQEHFVLRIMSCVQIASKISFHYQVDAFRERVTAEAEDLVASFFPKKLLELDSFLKEPLSNISDLATIHSDLNLPVPEPIMLTNSHDGLDNTCNIKKRKLEDGETNCPVTGTKVFIMPNGMLKSNQQLVEMIEKIKPEIRTLMEKCNTVKMWVQLLIPRIEDGNNFGVSIQEETVAELRTVESEAASYLDQISRYYITRAKLVSKVAKYPHVEDYRRTVSEIDEKEYISLRLIVSELRNQYVTLHDMILKNIEKIKRPRNSNADALY